MKRYKAAEILVKEIENFSSLNSLIIEKKIFNNDLSIQGREKIPLPLTPFK